MFNAFANNGNELFGITPPFELKYFGLFITLFSCLRLAIFNLDEEQTYYFKGLNTPSNTVLIFGISYILLEKLSPKIFEMEIYQIGLILLTFLSSWLLISPIKMIAMKFKSKKLEDNYPKVFLVTPSNIKSYSGNFSPFLILTYDL
jgi:CDP-diacylglycerol--serine O-phosphatidyltransferase